MKDKPTSWERRAGKASCIPALLAATTAPASAMHIMEGFLPQTHAVVWGVVCLPFLVWSFIAYARLSRSTGRPFSCWP